MPDDSSTPVVPGESSSKFDVKQRSNVDRKKKAIAVAVSLAMALPLAATISAPTVSAATAASSKVSSPCGKVSAASVAAIVGKSAPLEPYPVSGTIANAPPSVESGGNPATQTTCIYGDDEFTLTNTVTSAPVALSAIKMNAVQGAGQGLKIIFKSYSGFGVRGFRIMNVQTRHGRSGASTDEIGGISGKTVFAALGPNSLSVSKLAALAKLAKKL
jgi:hypothetical protein